MSGKTVDYKDIYTEGITKLTTTDFLYAKKMEMTVKLLLTPVDGQMHSHKALADEPIEALGGKTPLEYAATERMDALSRKGEVGMVHTITAFNRTAQSSVPISSAL